MSIRGPYVRVAGVRPHQVAAFASLIALLTVVVTPARAAESHGVRLVRSLAFDGVEDEFTGGTDMDFAGHYAYVGQMGEHGGLHIVDLEGKRPHEVGFLPCSGHQNDVAVVRPGLVALGYLGSVCGPRNSGGISLIDVSDPRRPRILGVAAVAYGGAHTLTAYPDRPLVYSSPGGWDQDPAGVFGIHYELEIIDVSDPRHPKVVGSFDPPAADCHDVSFLFLGDSELGFCAGDNQTQIWDVSDPLEPVVLARIVNPLISFHHSAETSDDGKLLVIGDENGLAECLGGTTGSLWVYDIEDPTTPMLLGHYDIGRGPAPGSTQGYGCTAHNFGFDLGTHVLTSAWYRAGMNVVDLTDPVNPQEIAYYMPDGGTYWSAYPYRGRIYASGMPGLDVFEMEALP